MNLNAKDDPLPVIIAGAGPCGLVAALTLQRSGVPFVLYERAAPAKLCSNAGSGIDMAPCAVRILETELGLGREGLDRAMRPYEYMHMFNMDGKDVATYRLKEMNTKITDARSFGFANRSDLQHVLLDALGFQDADGGIKEDSPAGGTLRCGMTVTAYRHGEDCVEVELSDGTTVKGAALLACDGIHSAVRKHMCRQIDDPLRYCGQECWWGKTDVRPGSELDKELKRVAKQHSMEDGNVSFFAMGTPKKPGAFFSCEVAENVHAWVYILKSKEPPAANKTNDLTRRGGTALTGEERKQEIERLVADRPAIVKAIMEHTPGSDVTSAGFFDRANCNVAYVDGRVALLGDAAHPQSPMMGQGANMAIVDGYVAATRLAAALTGERNNNDGIEGALREYDSDARRKDNAAVIKKARKYGKWACSKNRFTCWVLRASVRYMPPSVMVNETAVSGDRSNKRFVAAMEKDLQL